MSLLTALAIALGLTPAARWVGVMAGLVDRPEDPSLAIHARPVPVLGGVAVVAAALIATEIVGHGASAIVIGSTLIALAIGMADDIRPLPPAVRLVLLAIAGAVLAAGGVRVTPLGSFSSIGTVGLAVACANGINLLDGQNGLAGGVAAAAALGLAGVSGAGSGAAALGLGVAGGLIGFLAWNLAGVIFLGNGGAYAVGLLLAALAARSASAHGWRGFVAVVVCLGVIGFELAFTVVRRIGSRASLAAGDRLHAYDLVANRSGSRGTSTATFVAAGAVAAGVSLAVRRLPIGAGAGVALALAAAAGLWGRRLWATRNRTAND